MTVITREYAAGALLAEVCNINFDPLKTITLRCAKTPVSVEYLTGAGTWEALPFTAEGDNIKLPYPLACYELVILKVR